MARAAKTTKAKQAKGSSAKAGLGAYGMFLSPVVTEKTSLIGADRRRVVFKVQDGATKPEIKRAVESVFGVQVQAVRTCNVLGKVKRTSRSAGRRPGFKKAYVTLKPGQTIDIVEGV
jgi:large subunit ribosomal protein L23